MSTETRLRKNQQARSKRAVFFNSRSNPNKERRGVEKNGRKVGAKKITEKLKKEKIVGKKDKIRGQCAQTKRKDPIPYPRLQKKQKHKNV